MANIKNYTNFNMQIKHNTAIILAGGTGTRMKNKIPKHVLNGKVFGVEEMTLH